MTSTDAAFAAARDTAEAAARRRDETDTDWSEHVDAALALIGDHSMLHAEHTGRAMRAVEGDEDE